MLSSENESPSKWSIAHRKSALWCNISASYSCNLAGTFLHKSVHSNIIALSQTDLLNLQMITLYCTRGLHISLLAWFGRRFNVSLVQRVKISINHFQLSHAMQACERASSRHASHLRLEMEEGAGQDLGVREKGSWLGKERLRKERKETGSNR